MQESPILFSSDLYERNLKTIRNVYFTKREIDLMACLVNVRGSSKKIASFLSIAHKTVQKHIENIMAKIGCNATDSIINFVENSEILPFLVQYYSILQMEMIFEQSLKEITKINQKTRQFSCFIQDNHKDLLVSHIKAHLELVGFIKSTGICTKEEYFVIFILARCPDDNTILELKRMKQKTNEVFILLQDQKVHKEISEKVKHCNVIDFSIGANYYFSFFDFLQIMLPELNLAQIKFDFKNKYEKVSTTQLPQIYSNESNPGKELSILLNFSRLFSNKYYFLPAIFVFFIVSGFLALTWNQPTDKEVAIRSDFLLPKEKVFLQRPELLKLIDDTFQEHKNIQITAIVGQGGAGKTTIARQYAYAQQSSCVWEINAETAISLVDSFEKLAKTLANSKVDQKILKGIFKIKDQLEQGERIIKFVKERLQSKPNWFLIYDNVEKFEDIQKYFPNDSETWGIGKIIITTRNSNIESNSHVHHAIHIGELNPQQKISLYTSIMTDKNSSQMTEQQVLDLSNFLQKIPPFPLDVSIAAYYLKTTHASYAGYLENVACCSKDFNELQEALLKETGDYTKTRYGMIALSLDQIMNTHKDFRDLLLLINLVDSQKIPRELLTRFKGDVIVDNFIFNLKKYSLLINNHSESNFSIHRSTQSISLAYLTRTLNLEENKDLIKNIAKFLGDYLDSVIKEENITKMKALIQLYEMFLKHEKLLTDKIEGIIKSKLGVIHFFCSDNIKAKVFLEESLLKLKQSHEESSSYIAYSLGYLGNVVRDLGDYAKAKLLLEKSLSFYNTHPMKDPQLHAYFFVYLSIVETYLGNYKVSKDLLEKGLSIHKNYFPENKNYSAWVSGRLGVIERILGNYEKAEILLEDSLSVFQKYYQANDLDIAWAQQHLGVVYIKLKKYQKAKYAIAQSLKFWTSLFPDKIGAAWIACHLNSHNSKEQHEEAKYLFSELLKVYETHFHESYLDAGWHLGQLGILYRELGDYEKAKILLEQHKMISEKNLGDNHLGTALILNDLGAVYLLQGHLEISENLMHKAYLILEKNKHPTQYQCLENLSRLYLKKSSLALEKGKKETAQKFQDKAIDYLKLALDIVRKYFPKDSAHEKRIQENLSAMIIL